MIRNRVLIRWGDGYFRGDMDTSVATYGARSTLLGISQVSDGPTALRVGLATIEPMSTPEETVTIRVEPASDADTPGMAFTIADTITAPNIDGTATAYRVAACTWEQDGDYVSYTPELATARDIIEQRWHRWLTRTNQGTVDGRSRTATVTSPSVQESTVVEPIVIPFSSGGGYVLVAGDESAPRAADRELRLVKIIANCADAGTTSTVVEVLKNGAATGDTVTMTGSSTTGDAYFTAGTTFDYSDIIAISVTTAGGHAGASFELYFVEPGG